jgi:hypothetical protein
VVWAALGLTLGRALCAGASDEVTIAPGVTYRQLTRPGPVVAYVLKASLTEATLTPVVAPGGSRVLDLAPLGEIVSHYGQGTAVAGAINGGYNLLKTDQGAPVGLLLADGELLCDPWPTRRSCLLLPATGAPRIEAVSLHGSITGGDGQTQVLSGLNRPRRPGELVLYTPRYNPATRPREAGRQVVLTKVFGDGVKLAPGGDYVGEVAACVDGLAAIEIPADGVVLAGSGRAEAWLAERRVGEKVTLRFDLTPNVGPLRCALGAGPRLVRDGKVSVEAEAEGLAVAAAAGRQPRSAVGFSNDSLFLVAVDGRAPDYSIGVDCNELAALMVEVGCTQAMELAGGGATSLFVRDRIVNRPSDGAPRALASALLLLTRGKLSDVALPNPTVAGGGLVAPVSPVPPLPVTPLTPTPPNPLAPVPPAPPVGPGTVPLPLAGTPTALAAEPNELLATVDEPLAFKVNASGADRQAVALDLTKLRYEVTPDGLGVVDAQNRFIGKKEGAGHLTVTYGDLRLTLKVAVAKRSAAAAPPPIPPGENTTPVAAPPVPAAAGPLRPGQGLPRPKVDLPTGKWKQIDGFADAKRWRLSTYPDNVAAKAALVSDPHRPGAKTSLRLSYDFTMTEATRRAQLAFVSGSGQPVTIGHPKAVSVWVFGDGNGHWLRGKFHDRNGKPFVLTFTEYVNWDHYWARCTALVPDDAEGELTWEAIYLTEYRPEAKTAGAIFLDDFEGIY